MKKIRVSNNGVLIKPIKEEEYNKLQITGGSNLLIKDANQEFARGKIISVGEKVGYVFSGKLKENISIQEGFIAYYNKKAPTTRVRLEGFDDYLVISEDVILFTIEETT